MPFTPTPKPGFSRLFAFVDQFNANDPALRSEFDTFNADLDQSINDMIDYFEAAKNDATDQRFLGLSSNPPGTRNDHTLLNPSPLQEGDFYISVDSGDFGTFYFFEGGDWTALSGAAFSAFFLTLIGAADAAELRGLLGLGSAATSAAAAFATAAQGLKADSALQVPNLLANTVTDWDAVSTSKTGFYQSASGATNSPYSGDSFSAIYIARTATSGALIMIGNTSNRLFMRQYNTAWAEYREVSVRTTGQSGNLDNLGVGVIAVRFDDTATGAPSGYGTYNGLCEHYGSDTIRRQIVTIDGQDLVLMREHNGTSWGAWVRFIPPGVAQFSSQKTSGTNGASFPTGSAAALEITNTDHAGLGVTLASNQITFIKAGTYLVEAIVPFANASGAARNAQISLYNVTQAAEAARGQSSLTTNGVAHNLMLSAAITVDADDIIELRGIANGASALNGRAASLGTEVYNIVRVRAL